MSIKKLLLSALLLTTTGFAYAEDTTDFIKIDDCTLIAGIDNINEGIIHINLENDYQWVALQFDLYLPKGVEIGKTKNGKDYIGTTNRLKFENGISMDPFSWAVAEQSNEEFPGRIYRFIAYNSNNDPILDNENDENDKSIFLIRLIATDEATTGINTAYIKGAILSNSGGVDPRHPVVTGANCPTKDSSFKIQINAPIGAGGYGSFSWPRDVDFSKDANVAAVYIAKEGVKNGWLHLDELTDKRVPKETGVFVKVRDLEDDEEPITVVNPVTLEETLSSIEDNKLGNTAKEAFPATPGTYALKTVGGVAGLHPVTSGTIPMYKAYLSSTTTTAKYISFGDTATSIDALDMAEEEGDIYTLGGQKVQQTTMKGVYIKNGKKVVVK